ncbi:preprotein translocase subunit SecE [Intestinicryptomonas porci]|uniref:Protein translocase subunit SecE n=1 Tax=Intestinicryptomonas porci TaxID=2926320 RepID=A0ABU4WDD7_9BACT|nr:preprotein translocase subunit SecE [Opitutales bacterium]MDX8414572.1 preprotein translocase subunit SecE [Opitutales bacterium CLA-KB-P66]
MANPFSRVRQFYKETVAELKKANWPNASEIRSSMLVVFVAILLLGAFIALADFSVYNVVDMCTALVNGK